MVVAAHPAAQLVEVRQAEAVGPVDDDRVRVRDVQTRLYDRRADQHVHFPQDEPLHDVLEVVRRQLTVPHGQARLRDELLEPLEDTLDSLYAIVEEVHLSLALQLSEDGVPDQTLVVLGHHRGHRQPVAGRGHDGAEVAQARQAEIECARDRRGCHGQDVHIGSQVLQLLLVPDPEPLFLVDDDEPEIAEHNVPAEEPVRPDHDVDPTIGQVTQNGGLLGGGAESTEHLDGDGVLRHPLPEGDVVLLCEDGRRHEHGGLSLVQHGPEGGPHRHLRLPVAHVPAKQPVHRLRTLHVSEHVPDGLALVFGLTVGERVTEPSFPRGVGGLAEAARILPDRLQPQKVRGNVGSRYFGCRLCVLPDPAPQPAQFRQLPPAAHVTADQVRLVQRDIQAGVLGELQLDDFLDLTVELQLADTVEPADSVRRVDGVFALIDLHAFVHGVVGAVVRRPSSPPPLGPPAEELARAQQHQVRPGQEDAALQGEHFADDRQTPQFRVLGQAFPEAPQLAAAGATGHHTAPQLPPPTQVVSQLLPVPLSRARAKF